MVSYHCHLHSSVWRCWRSSACLNCTFFSENKSIGSRNEWVKGSIWISCETVYYLLYFLGLKWILAWDELGWRDIFCWLWYPCWAAFPVRIYLALLFFPPQAISLYKTSFISKEQITPSAHNRCQEMFLFWFLKIKIQLCSIKFRSRFPLWKLKESKEV